MRPSTVMKRLRAGDPAMFYCLHLTDPSVWEMATLMGFDCIWFDMEHHAHNMETANHLFRAARVGTSDIIARPGKGEYMRMLRMMEAGAHGILYPRCSGAEEAREVVRWAKFAPLGERGFDGGNPDMPYCSMDMKEYIKFANDETYVIIQCESEQCAEEAEAILSIDGVSGIMLGPADFTVLSGIPGEFNHPKVQAALDKLRKAAENTGKHWGMACGRDRTKSLTDAGARLIFTGADIVILKTAFEQVVKDYSAMGFKFTNRMTHGASYMEKA